MSRNVLIDTREFVRSRYTGIGRVLEGLIEALTESSVVDNIFLVESQSRSIPGKLKNRHKMQIKKIPSSFIESEKFLSDFTKNGVDLFISPYPKLPLFGVHCLSVNIVHDVLDLTHPAYRRRVKIYFDKFRLKTALNKANLTWYMSHWSMHETQKLVGFAGRNPQVRYSGISDLFDETMKINDNYVLKKYKIQPGSILVIGNGMLHKNLGVLLKISNQLKRKLLFIGVSDSKQRFWKSKYPESDSTWVSYASDEDIPDIIKGCFCLAQPSTAEGYGLPPLEAMACGIPSVVSNIPVLAETTGHNALTANPEDPEEWKIAIGSLEDRELYQNLIKNGLEWVKPLRGKRGWDKHICDIANLIGKE